MKKVAIVADNWKVSTFKKEFKKADFFFVDKPFTKGVTSMFIMCPVDRMDELTKLVKTIEFNLKNSN